MRESFFQKTLFCFLALSVLFSFAACSEEKVTETLPLPTGEAISTDAIFEEPWDITGKIEIFSAGNDSGELTKPGESNLLDIESAEDLAPYKSLFPELDEAREKSLLEDEGGRLIFMEIVQAKEGFAYFCNSVCRYDGLIEVFLTEAEEEEALKHQYFLFYFPSDVYSLEDVQVVFVQ